MSTTPDSPDAARLPYYERHRRVTATWGITLMVVLGLLLGVAVGALLVGLVHLVTGVLAGLE